MAATRCTATTATGRQCRNPARPGGELCGTHLRRAQSAFTPERAALLVAALGAGNAQAPAARAVGIGERTLREWLRLGRLGREPFADFARRVETARMEGEVRQVTQIATAAGQGEWRAGAWLLERRFGEPPESPDTAAVAEAAAARARTEAETTLTSLGEPVALSAGAVDRYATAVGVWASLEAQWVAAGRPGIALGGATGQAPVPHPLLGQIAVARRQASELATLLGMDPIGRMRLSRHIGAGRPPGSASAADRVAGPPRRQLRVVD
jgi:hypothetical protein